MRCFLIAVFVLIGSVRLLAADLGDPAGVAEVDPAAEAMLGPAFESRAAGIALRPPEGSKEIRRGLPDEIVCFVQENRQWVLRVMRFTLPNPTPLSEYKDAAGKLLPGVLEQTTAALLTANPGAELLRQDVANVDDGDVGMIAIRYNLGTVHKLLQQGLIRENDRVYYVLEFTTPGAPPLTPAEVVHPAERAAVDTFAGVLDSIKLFDRGGIKQDQEMRLFRTRELFLSLTEERLRAAIVPQQWLRLIKNGKDIGYTYIIESDQKPDKGTGLSIGIRSRTYPEPGVQVDAESWFFTTWDRKQEEWSNVAALKRAGSLPEYVTELGSTLHRLKPVPDEAVQDGDNRGVQPVNERTLEVMFISKSGALPAIKQDLPPFYIPQALGQIIPRLLPLKRQTTYLFAVYVPDQRSVMLRYVDVEPERDVKFGGRSFRARAVKDRIGLEGSVTTHYITAAGEYMGSVNADSKIVVVPTDADALKKLWKDADLSAPKLPDAALRNQP